MPTPQTTVIVVKVRQRCVTSRVARGHTGGLIRPGVVRVFQAGQGCADTKLARTGIGAAFPAVIVGKGGRAVDGFRLIVVGTVVLLVRLVRGDCAQRGFAQGVRHRIGITAVVVVGVVAARSRDGAGRIARFAVEIVVTVSVGIGFLQDGHAAVRAAAGADRAVVIIDNAAGIGGGQRIPAGGGTTRCRVAADVVVGVGAGVQFVVGIGAAGTHAVGGVADGFAAVIAVGGGVSPPPRELPTSRRRSRCRRRCLYRSRLRSRYNLRSTCRSA